MRTSPAPSEVASPVGAGEASPAAASPAGAAVLPLFAAAIFAGAFLLFAVEPLIGRFVLPWFGGSPGVWTTCMLFFQVMLLAGYAYAMCSVRYLPPRAHADLATSREPIIFGLS